MINYFSISEIYNKFIRAIRSILEYCFLLIIMLQCSSMYLVMEQFFDSGKSYDHVRENLVTIMLALIVVNILIEGIHITIKQLIAAGLMVIYILIYKRVTTFDFNTYMKDFVKIFFLMYLICCLSNRRDYFKTMWSKYANIVICMAVLSLIFYIGGEMLHVIPSKPLLYRHLGTWKSGKNYFYVYFVNFIQNRPFLGMSVVRNVGPFMEAPGFALPLSFALWWELFNGNQVRKLRVAILMITMATTFSMKSILMLFCLLVVFIWKHAKETGFEHLRLLMFASAFFGMILVGLYVAIVNRSLFMNMGSVAWRMQDTIAAFLTWLDYPIWGCGYSNYKIMLEHFIDAAHAGYTAGLFNVMAYGGLVLLSIYIIMLCGYFKVNRKYLLRNSVLFIMFIVFLFMTSMQYKYFTLFLLTNGLAMLTNAYQADENGQIIKKDKLIYQI